MTYEEALKIINKNIQVAIHDLEGLEPEYEKEQLAALRLSKEALEKQIPKKPIQDEVAENIFYCPYCTAWFNGYHKPHHCRCGQALDWSD